MKRTVALVLGGGRGTRLYPLTKYRSKPAVPLAGKYRLIDIPLSNCINSGLSQIYVLTQFLSVSLHRHIRSTYRFDQFNNGFVELLAAQQTMAQGTDWYEGTADAVRKNLRYLQQPGIEHVLILSGDQLYRMDYAHMLDEHKASGADVSIASLPVARQEASSLGIMRVNNDGRVIGFVEKPQTDEELASVSMDPAWINARGVDCRGRECLASMGIYLFNRDTLVELLESTDHQDFGREVFPQSIENKQVQVYLFDDYWEDIGTIKSFYQANLDLAQANPPFALASPTSPIYSRARFLPPTRMDQASVSQSLVADGCTIEPGAVIENSVIGLRCHIGRNAVIRDSVLMGSDAYQSSEERQADLAGNRPPVGIGEGSVIEGALIDKNCRIGRNVKIERKEDRADAAELNDICQICDGIVVVEKDAALPDGWALP